MRLQAVEPNMRYSRSFIPILESLSNDLADPAFDGTVYWRVRREEPLPSCWPKLLVIFSSCIVSPFSSLYFMVGIVGLGSHDSQGVNRSYPSCIADHF